MQATTNAPKHDQWRIKGDQMSQIELLCPNIF